MSTDTKASSHNRPTRLVLIGIGGYGHFYIEHIRALHAQGVAKLSAVVDPRPELSPDWPEVQQLGIPVYATLEEYLSKETPAELAIICSPIPYHADQTCAALAAGMHVLCEKPIAATLADGQRMQAAADARPDLFLEIAYQWSFSRAIQSLKHDILQGELGAPLRLRTRVAWPRDKAYYTRNNWTGCIQTPQGQPVFDSPVSNATAHYLHNMLYLCGPTIAQSARPLRMEAECYRANPIETFDAACCRLTLDNKAELIFYTAHCVELEDGPHFCFEFENGTVSYSNGTELRAVFKDGSERNYGKQGDDTMRKLDICAARCRQPSPDICPPAAAMAHTVCVHGFQEVTPHVFKPEQLQIKGEPGASPLTYLPEMNQAMIDAYDTGKLFSENATTWAMPAQSIDLTSLQP